MGACEKHTALHWLNGQGSCISNCEDPADIQDLQNPGPSVSSEPSHPLPRDRSGLWAWNPIQFRNSSLWKTIKITNIELAMKMNIYFNWGEKHNKLHVKKSEIHFKHHKIYKNNIIFQIN